MALAKVKPFEDGAADVAARPERRDPRRHPRDEGSVARTPRPSSRAWSRRWPSSSPDADSTETGLKQGRPRRHGITQRHAHAHRLGQGDAEDHQGDADGRRRQAAARPGSRARRPALRRSGWTGSWPTSIGASPARKARRRCSSAPARSDVHLLVVMTAERGLCGGFNTNIAAPRPPGHPRACARPARRSRSSASAARASTTCAATTPARSSDRVDLKAVKQLAYVNAEEIADKILAMFEAGEFDVATIYYLRIQERHHPEADGAAAHSGEAAGACDGHAAGQGRGDLRVRAVRGGNSRPAAASRTSRRRSSAACSRTRPASRARA